MIKTSTNFLGWWISCLILGIPILFLLKYFNLVFIGIILFGGIILYYFLFKKTITEQPVLHMTEDKLEFKNKILEYDKIEYFQFIGYKNDKELTLDLHWWTPKTLQLHIKTKNGQILWNAIPNKMGNYEVVKQKIRTVFVSKKIVEKKERLR